MGFHCKVHIIFTVHDKSFAKEAVLAAILSTYNILQLEKVLPRSHGGPNAKKPGRLPGPDLGKGNAMIYQHPLHVPSQLQMPSCSIVFSDKEGVVTGSAHVDCFDCYLNVV